KRWWPAQGKERFTLKGHTAEVWTLAFSPKGGTLVSGGQDNSVIVWDPQAGQLRQVLQGHKEAITALALHPHGRELLSGSEDGTVLRWAATGTQVAKRDPGQGAKRAADSAVPEAPVSDRRVPADSP